MLIMCLGVFVPVYPIFATSRQEEVKVVFREMLDRDPQASELDKYVRSAKKLSVISSELNKLPERSLVIKDIYQKALKRNPRADELSALIKFVAPANRIRKSLYESNERKLALEDLYMGLIWRLPRTDEFNFFINTRTPFDRIKLFLNGGKERLPALEKVFLESFQRLPTDAEKNFFIDGFVYLSSLAKVSIYEDYLLKLMNDLRREEGETGAKPLAFNSKLGETAKDYASYSLQNVHFSHFDLGGKGVDSRVLEHNYDFEHVGENLGLIKTDQSDFALGFAVVDSLFDGWRKSPEHYKNIISEKFDEVGIGFALGKTSDVETPNHLYAVVVFGHEFPKEGN